MNDLFDFYPYAERFGVNRELPDGGRSREEILTEMREMATEEDEVWEDGKCSGTMYCGDRDHYAFLKEAFGLFAHQNALQRDMCPSATRFEGEIIAMALSLMHADVLEEADPAGMVTSGGSGSIEQAVVAYREEGREGRGIERPNLVKPETAHPAFDKACHLFGVELRRVPVDAETTLVQPDDVAEAIDEDTVAIIGSAGNYGYGTIDPIAELGQLALDRGVGLHVDGCLGGYLLPFGEELGYPIPPFDFRVPGVTTISADTHKYGYGLKGNSTLLFRDRELRNRCYFFMPDWSGGKYFSPGMEGSRSDGLLAATWASLVSIGHEGYREYAKRIFETSAAMQDVVRSHEDLRLLGKPTFLFAFTSDEFDIYHVNDEMKRRGWRFNGLQYPNALHMAVTRPQTEPGVVAAFEGDLDAAVAYARKQGDEPAESSAVYGGVPGGHNLEAEELIRGVMTQLMDSQQSIPRRVNERESRSERFALAIDLGSGALKLGAVSLDGEIAAVAQRDYETERIPGGGAIQDASAWWEMVRELSGSVMKGIPPERVVAVSCTGQWASTVPVDEGGEPVGPCVMWLDTRGARHSRDVIGGPVMGYSPTALATWIRHTGGVPSPFGGDPVSHMLHLERDEPQVAAAARWYLEPVDYLSMRFTGRAAASHASMSAAWLTDNRRLDRLEYDPTLVRRSGLDPGKLPPLVETGSLIGAVRPEVAADLGISPEAQVVTGTPDLHSGALGCGAIGEGEPHMTISTTSWISLPFPRKKTDPLRSIATAPGLDSHSYLIANNHEAAGLCLRWLRESFTVDEPADYERLIELAEGSSPGSGGILFTPWIAGERSPVDDRHARGGWHNLSVETRNADLVRSVLEGVAYNSRWLNEAVERFAKRRLDPLRIFGGGAIPDLWCQIHADVMDRRIERVAEPVHANLRGAALLAGLALGAVSRAEVRDLVPVDRDFSPDPSTRETYDRLYREFPGLYKAQRKMFARLNG